MFTTFKQVTVPSTVIGASYKYFLQLKTVVEDNKASLYHTEK